jgi:hypothetical protein
LLLKLKLSRASSRFISSTFQSHQSPVHPSHASVFDHLHPLNTLPGIHSRTSSSSNLAADPRRRAADVRAVEEAHEEVHERAKVKHIQPHRERLPSGVNTADRLVLLIRRTGSWGGVDGATVLGDWGGGRGGVGGDGDVVGEEGVGGGVVDADYELRDLEGGESLLDGFWDADVEGGDGVVCVLGVMLVEFIL